MNHQVIAVAVGALIAVTMVPPGGAGDPVAEARRILDRYDDAVRQYKLTNGFNVTLQLDDFCPAVATTWTGVPLDEVARGLEQVCARAPEHPTARLVLAQVHARQGRDREAAEVLSEQVQHRPDAASWNALGVACARLGQGKRKVDCYQHAVQLDPRHGGAWANLCNALAADNRPQEAITAGLKAVAIDPLHVYAWMNLGVAYGLARDAAREKAAYLHAVEVPAGLEQCPFARFNLALCYEREQNYQEAARWYRAALTVGLPQGPRSKQAALFHHNLARALYHASRLAEATTEATQAIRTEPRLPEPYSLLGHIFAKAGHLGESQRMFRIATGLLKRYGVSKPDSRAQHVE